MTESLEDFIARRDGELAVAENKLRAELNSVCNERQQLRKAAQAAGIADSKSAVSATAVLQAPDRQALSRRTRNGSEKTIKEAVVEILAEVGKGMTANELLPAVNERLQADYSRSSLSPQLSRLRHAGELERNDKVWMLTRWARSFEATDDLLTSSESVAPIQSNQAKGREAVPGGGT